MCTHRASTHNFLHTFRQLDIQIALAISYTKSELPWIKIVEIIRSPRVKTHSSFWLDHIVWWLISVPPDCFFEWSNSANARCLSGGARPTLNLQKRNPSFFWLCSLGSNICLFSMVSFHFSDRWQNPPKNRQCYLRKMDQHCILQLHHQTVTSSRSLFICHSLRLWEVSQLTLLSTASDMCNNIDK